MEPYRFLLILTCLSLTLLCVNGRRHRKREDYDEDSLKSAEEMDSNGDFDELEPCQCGVFMSQQVGLKEGRRGRPRGPPEGEPVVTYDTEEPCGAGGFKSCVSKCLDVILKYLPRAGPVICGAAERDIHREKAFLFIKSCGGEWTPTSFSAGKEFCCTDGQYHKC